MKSRRLNMKRNDTSKVFEGEIVTKAKEVLRAYKDYGLTTAYASWQALDAAIAGKRQSLSDQVLDLVLQLEFLMEKHPATEWNDVVTALNVAEAALKQRH